jgi:PAS domain S-box-containing protein
MQYIATSRWFPLSAWCMLMGGLCASLALSFWAYRQEQRIEQANFERRAVIQVAAVKEGVGNALEALQVIHQLFITSGSVSREQFHSFTQPLRERYPYIEAFAFNRLVSHAERPAFEARMRSRYPGFAIAEMIDGQRGAAAAKNDYRVIDYLEPMSGNEAAFGLDVSSHPFLDEAIRHAADTGLPAATGLYPLFRDRTGAERGFQLLMPVYQIAATPDNIASRRQKAVGYIVAVLRADALFEKILGSANSQGNAELDIRVYAAASADESKLAYSPSGVASAQQIRWQPPSWLGDQLEPLSLGFDVAGTKWYMVVSAVPTPFASMHASALLALMMGLLATFAATACVRLSALRTQRIEQLVAQRTADLKQANNRLIEDIAARQQAEQALACSEERAHELAELSSDWFWALDEHFCFTRHSVATREYQDGWPSVLLGTSLWSLPVDPEAADWTALRVQLEAHQPFKNFEYRRLIDGSSMQWLSASGKPLFDANGQFKGYLGTATNIHTRKQAEQALRESESALRQLASHLQQVREDERKRIARDIHDDLGQNLMVLRIDVARMASCSDSAAVTAGRIAAALRQVDTTIKALRAILNDLRPTALDLGLPAALEWQTTEFAQRTGIACQLQIGSGEFALDEQCATGLFRAVQEALSNVVRHARASQVQIDLQRTDDRLLVKIADDGIGLATDRRKSENTFGLVGMEERMLALGGTLSIASSPGQGTAVLLSIPL